MAESVIHGMRELLQGFADFPKQIERKALNRIMRAGGRPIVRIARGKVSKVSGKLARQIRVTVVRDRRTGWITARIIAGRNKAKDDAFYALMVELGTKPHQIRPKNREALSIAGTLAEVVEHPGARPHPFLGPALEEGAQEAVDAMQAELTAQLEGYWG